MTFLQKIEEHNKKGIMIMRKIPSDNDIFNGKKFSEYDLWDKWSITSNYNYPHFIQIIWNK
jgi:hypothetical protein